VQQKQKLLQPPALTKPKLCDTKMEASQPALSLNHSKRLTALLTVFSLTSPQPVHFLGLTNIITGHS
jgi:hypothetical protein